MVDFKFSVIIAVYNSDLWIKDTVDSIINQTIGFEDNIEIILVNDASEDLSEEICLKYKAKYPKNIKYLPKDENEGASVCRNLGLQHASGKYVNFLDSDDIISKNTFQNVYNFFEKHYDRIDIVSIPIYFFEDKKGGHILNFKYKKNQVVNLFEHPNYIQLSASSSFFKRSKIESLEFDPNLVTSEDVTFINQLLLKNPNIGFCKGGKYFYRKRFLKSSIIDNSIFEKEYFNLRIKYYFKKLILESLRYYKEVPLFIQYTLMYDLQWMFDIGAVDNILSDSEIEKLHHDLFQVLQFIDDEVIANQSEISNSLKAHILYTKYENKLKDNFYEISNKIIDRLQLDTVYLDIYEINNDKLYIMGVFTTFFSNSEIFCYVNGHKVRVNELQFPQREKFSLNINYSINHNFEVTIPLKKNHKYKIEFKSSLKNLGKLHIDFNRPCNFSKIAGYHRTKDFISKLEDKSIIIKRNSKFRWIKREIKTLFSMLKNHEQGFKTGIPFRCIYMFLYPFMKNKRIWLFMDLPSIADDNGLHLFKYAVNKNLDVDKFFVVEKSSKSFNEVSEIGPVIAYKSVKHRILALFAEKIITSHPDNGIIYPFWGNYPHFAGLLKSRTIFLQHGITKDNVSNWLNKYDKNLALLITCSMMEYKSFFCYDYNYKEDVVKLTGFPRFDNLRNDETKKQIVIMPSWRRFLKHKSRKVIMQSDFFKKMNSLINNEKLIEIAKKYGYEIIFKPHPNVYDFIDLFETNDFVKIDYDRIKYQEFFNKSSLLITDYSSVAFDFAYLHKPVLYYHYSNDYHFDLNESYFDYDKMGFGETIHDENDLIDLIEEYLANDCKVKEKYEERINNFFTFNDKNNCQRVYDEIKRLNF